MLSKYDIQELKVNAVDYINQMIEDCVESSYIGSTTTAILSFICYIEEMVGTNNGDDI